MRIGRIQHRERGLVFRAAALGRHRDLERVARHDFHVNDGGRVVVRVLSIERGIGDDGRAQLVVGMVVGAAHAFVDHVGETHRRIPLHIHADLDEHRDDAGVLADRPMTFGAHARIHQNLFDRILGRRALLRARRPRPSPE